MKQRAIAVLCAMTALTAPWDPLAAQWATEPVTLEEAVRLFGDNSPELALARSRLRGALGAARQGKAIPNPLASVTHEAVGDYSESYFNMTQRVDFLWESGARRKRAGAHKSQARARFQADSARLVLELKRAYVTAWQRRELLGALGQAAGVVTEVLAAAEARFAEGDLAGYDLRRLRLERSRFARLMAVAELELEDAERLLGSFLGESDTPQRVRAGELDPVGPGPAIEGDPVALALSRRPEIVSAQAAASALRAETSLARASALSGTSVTGGFKRQSDGSDGLFVGLEVPLPFTDRKGGAVDVARAAAGEADAELALLRRAIARQVSVAVSRLESLRRQQAQLGPDGVREAEALLGIARLAYAEGEIGIVELLDAAGAFVEARTLDGEVSGGLWNAHFEVEQAVGGFPDEIESRGDER